MKTRVALMFAAMFALCSVRFVEADVLCVQTVRVDRIFNKRPVTEYHVVSVSLSPTEPCPRGAKPVRDRSGAVAQFSNPTEIKDISLNTFMDNLEELNAANVGPQGPAGPQGAAGAVGPVGPAGAQGARGEVGPAGPQGARGEVGAQGPAGPQGATGAIGPVGPVGPQGARGEVGPAGPQGARGEVGPQGAAGPVGPQGAIGATGPQGPAGPQGARGEMGPQGPRGEAGPQGATGPAGPVGPQGLRGEVGPVGPQGATGPQGLAGPATLNQRWGIDYFDWWDVELSTNPHPTFKPFIAGNCSTSATFPGNQGINLAGLSQAVAAGQKLVPGAVYSVTVWGVIQSSGSSTASYDSWVGISDWQGGVATNFLWKRGGARGSNFPDGAAPYSTTLFARANPNGDIFLRQPCGNGEVHGLSYFRMN